MITLTLEGSSKVDIQTLRENQPVDEGDFDVILYVSPCREEVEIFDEFYWERDGQRHHPLCEPDGPFVAGCMHWVHQPWAIGMAGLIIP